MSARRRQSKRGKSGANAPEALRELPHAETAIKTEQEVAETKHNEDVPDYEKVRMENIRRNQEFMQSLGLGELKTDLDAQKPHKQAPSKRGVSSKRSRAAAEPVRRSTRHKGGVDGEALVDTLEQYRLAAEAAAVEKWTRLPPEPISMQVPLDNDGSESEESESEEHKEEATPPTMVSPPFVDILRNSEPRTTAVPAHAAYMKRAQQLRLTEHGVAKVVKERGQSIAFHPGADKLVVLAGDKYGQLGIWNVDGTNEPNDGVTTYQLHKSSIIHIEFLPRDSRKLLTMGYDSVFRLGDLESESFVELHRAPEEMDELFYSFCCLSARSDDLVYISRSDACVSVLDMRAAPHTIHTTPELHDRKINTVQVCPTDENVLVTAGLDQTIKLWDIRKLGGKKPTATNTIQSHTKSINAAFISPDGARMVSVGLDDTVKLFDDYKTSSSATHTVRHNNQTGRWLTKFKPTWDPKQPDMFFMGSMERPRRGELFHAANGKLKIVHQYSGSADFPVTAVMSLLAVHPSEYAFAGINSSGRVTVFRP